ncbi:asparaginase [Yinghuangia seranimata]|uniref:asparaginase n=1 Tax=Yinghuangia seranimata TaxID=408067 RepID=UPI00248C0092|nr:asparaginase [Yinghuangia seranimata]MDI2131764.1 asparaginase [Yinghuangia seranimata]
MTVPSPSSVPGAIPASVDAVEPVLAEVVRSGFVEGRHRGALVALDADGSVAFSMGDVTRPVFPRSTTKPAQAVATLRAGVDLDGELLALAAASHSGEGFHLDGVRKILAAAGLDPAALRTPAQFPFGEQAFEDYLRGGKAPDPLVMNCSGKHAGWLAACVANGWDTETYLAPAHPLQQLVLRTIEELADERVAHLGVDGCGAPVPAISLTGLARLFRSMVSTCAGSPQRRVAAAMQAYPEYVAGTGRVDTLVMRGVPGLIAKMGAEGVQGVALPDGRALAFKVDDGGVRVLGPILAAALRRLGVDAPVLDEIAEVPLLGGGVQVGAIRAAFAA